MKKLIIHVTDCHGCGKAIYGDKVQGYWYDGEMGDIAGAVQFLIDLGFINPEDVCIFEDDEFYKHVELKNEV